MHRYENYPHAPEIQKIVYVLLTTEIYFSLERMSSSSKNPTGYICFSLVPTDQLHYLVRVTGCTLVCLYALQVDEPVLWDYWGLAASWGLGNCGCCFGVTGSLPELVVVGTGVGALLGIEVWG